jgi:hypothetical protein
MSIFNYAYEILTRISSTRIGSGNQLAKHYRYAIPWMYGEILVHLRRDNDKQILNHKRNKETLKQLLIHKVLVWANKLQLVFSKNADIIFLTSSTDHHAQYIELEPILKAKSIRWVYVTNKLKIYQELKRKRKCVYFLDNANNNHLNQFYVSSGDIETFEKALDLHIKKNFSYFKYLENQLLWMMNKLSPKVIITANELLIPHRIAIMLSKEKAISTICLQHGYISKTNIIYKEMLSDQFLVYGQVSKQAMLDMGYDEKRIQIVGSLLYKIDLIKTNPSLMYLNTEKNNVLVALSGAGNSTSLNHHLKQIQSIDVLARFLPDVQFLIKLHPKDEISLYRVIKSENIRVVSHTEFVNNGGNFSALIAGSSAMITSVSASMYDAFKFGVPVCILDLENEYAESDVIQSKAVTYCKSSDELLNYIQQIINQNGYHLTIQAAKEYLLDFYYLTEKADVKTLVYQVISNSFHKNLNINS